MSFNDELLEKLPLLRSIALKLLAGNCYGFEPEDLVQDTAIRALEKRSLFRPGSNFCAWLWKLEYNAFINMLRKRSTCSFTRIDESFDTPDTREVQEYSFSDDSENIMQGMGLRGEVLRLQSAGMTTAEISMLLGVPKGTVFSSAARARDEFREKWRRRGKEQEEHQ